MPYNPQLDPIELQDELDELEDRDADDDPLEADEIERRDAIRALAESIDGWPHISTFVHEDDFQRHAEDLAKDIIGVDFDKWPFTCIDWKEAAEELQSDYTIVEFDGETYYVLS